MAVYRNIVGSIKDAQGSLVASGRIKVKPLTPVIDGTAFVSPERVTVDVTSGLFDLALVAPCIYEFIVEDIYEESMWTFVATLTDDSEADITLSELYAYGRVEIDDTVSLITTFSGLWDTPDSFIGGGGLPIVVTAEEDGLEYGTTPLVENHSQLGELDEDQHEHYLLADGTRELAGDWGLGDDYGLEEIHHFDFSLTPAGVTDQEGRVYWNSLDKTLNIGTGGAVLQTGQEMFVRVYNDTGVQIDNGAVVSSDGSVNGRPSAILADATDRRNARATLGIATENIAPGAEGMVTIQGLVRGVNTAAYAPGAPLFLHASNPGELQAYASPEPPISIVFVGVCITQDAVDGVIYASLVVSPSLTELVDVDVTSPENAELLVYNAATTTFENKIPTLVSKATLTDHVVSPDADEEMNFWGGIQEVISGGVVSSGVPETGTNGCGRLLFCVHAGSDLTGSLTITGDTRDPVTGVITAGNTEVLPISGVSTDSSITNVVGKPVWSMVQVYVTDNWFQGDFTVTTTDLNISDFEVYNIAFFQFGDTPLAAVLDSVHVTAYNIDDANGWMYTYLYSLEKVNGFYNLNLEAAINFNNEELDAPNRFMRGSVGSLAKTLAPSTDGIFVQMWCGVNGPADWGDISLIFIYSAAEPLTLV